MEALFSQSLLILTEASSNGSLKKEKASEQA